MTSAQKSRRGRARGDSPPRPTGKSPRSHLTHLEVHRGKRLLLGIMVADSEITKIGDELGALIKKISPGTRTAAPAFEPEPADLVISPLHADDDEPYHAAVREHFTDLFSSLCDGSLADALQIARDEQTRRTAGRN